MNTIQIAAVGLRDDLDRLGLTSQNVANVSTPGYKRLVAISTNFVSVMNRELTLQTVVSGQVDSSNGPLRMTGGKLDIALDRRQFLSVKAADGKSALSGGGALQMDGHGRLVTSSHAVIQGKDGEIAVPPTAIDVHVESNGDVFADGKRMGGLDIVDVNAEAIVIPQGGGLYRTPDDQPRSIASPTVQVGRIEMSNVAAAREMTDVMQISRHAESMTRLLQGADDLLEKTIRKLGELS